MTGLRVAFDLDGVLANLEEPYIAAKQALFGADDPRGGSAADANAEDESGASSPTALGCAA
jgi:phosphoglycolate phosphatase-like HAD superfamily hydrolase